MNCIFMTTKVKAFKPQHIREIHFLNQSFGLSSLRQSLKLQTFKTSIILRFINCLINKVYSGCCHFSLLQTLNMY